MDKVTLSGVLIIVAIAAAVSLVVVYARNIIPAYETPEQTALRTQLEGMLKVKV